MAKDEIPGTGGYAKPGPLMLDMTRENILAEGGVPAAHDLIHRAKQVDWDHDAARIRAERAKTGIPIPAYTCGCGRPGVEVALPNPRLNQQERKADEKARPLKVNPEPVHACINCDGVHLMPKYKPASFSRGGFGHRYPQI